MKKRRLIAILLVLVLVGAFVAACTPADPPPAQPPAQQADPPAQAADPPAQAADPPAQATDPPPAPAGNGEITIGFVMIDLTNQFFIDLMEGGNLAAEQYGVNVIWSSAEGSFEQQIALMENFIAMGVDVIVSDPLDSLGMTAVKQQASAAGIPTITMAGYVDVPTNFTTVYNDFENSRVTALLIGHELGGEGQVALLYGNRGNLVSDLRREGFHAGIAEFPGIQLIEQPMNWDPAQGMEVATAMLAANPNLAAIHSVSDAVTLAVHQAVILAGREGDIIITSYDGNPDGIDLVEDGTYLINTLTGARRTGFWNVHLAIQLSQGYRPAERIMNMDTHFIVNPDNYAALRAIVPNASIITPAQARVYSDNYWQDIFDPNLMG